MGGQRPTALASSVGEEGPALELRLSLLGLPPGRTGVVGTSAPLEVPSDGHWLDQACGEVLEPWARGRGHQGLGPVLGWGGGQPGWKRSRSKIEGSGREVWGRARIAKPGWQKHYKC